MKDMMTTSDFADVTLVTDDKQQIRAHRNILSVCSPVFKNIFQLHSSNNANPVVYLRGIQHSEMESIMQFLYLGEARFHEDRMSEFFQVAKDLEIKSISTGIDMNVPTAWKVESNEHEMNIVADEDPEQSFKKDANVKNHPQTVTRIKNNTPNKKLSTIDTIQVNLKSHIQSTHECVKYACNQCDKQYSDKSNLTKHIQSKHEGIKYACYECDYQATRQDNLTSHIQSVHEGVKYACNQCEYKATQKTNLRTHIKKKHLSKQ